MRVLISFAVAGMNAVCVAVMLMPPHEAVVRDYLLALMHGGIAGWMVALGSLALREAQ